MRALSFPATYTFFAKLGMRFTLASIAIFGLNGCVQSEGATQNYEPKFIDPSESIVKSYSFAIHPLHNPTRLHEVFQPMIDYLNQQIGEAHFYLEASRDYPSYDRKLQNHAVDFALPNPYQTINALSHGYRVFAKMADDEQFRGIFLVRKNSHFTQPKDLIHHKISYPAPTALAATMMPQYFLYQHGVKLSDVENHYVGSQESSIMNVFHGLTDAAATWPPPWEALSQERPELKESLKVIWQTDTLPNNGLIARNALPDALVNKVKLALLDLHKHKAGQEILQKIHLSKFETADNETYRPVKEFIENFTKTVRLPSEAK